MSTMRPREPMSTEAANAVFDTLIAQGVLLDRGYNRAEFVSTQTRRFCSEYRIQGNLMFGGKFWRNTRRRPDGTYGEIWYVSAYPEDTTPKVAALIETATAALEALRAEHVDETVAH